MMTLMRWIIPLPCLTDDAMLFGCTSDRVYLDSIQGDGVIVLEVGPVSRSFNLRPGPI